jgi:hypothetical protein
MPLIWGNRQYRRLAADWRDGQFAHGAHAYFARRATGVIARRKATKQSRIATKGLDRVPSLAMTA